MSRNSRILIIPDLHIPYHHIHSFKFLAAVKKKYRPDRVISLGDEIDGHSISMHDHDPDLPSPEDEFSKAVSLIKTLCKMFPALDLVESNHGSLIFRRAKKSGLPARVLKSYREVLGAPSSWHWHEDMTVTMSNGQPLYIHHSKGSNALKVSQAMGMSYIQGHHHEQFSIEYWGNPLGLYWAVTSGCLIDKKSLAFAYGRNNIKRPLLGCTMIIDGLPRLIPMVLDARGRWIGALP